MCFFQVTVKRGVNVPSDSVGHHFARNPNTGQTVMQDYIIDNTGRRNGSIDARVSLACSALLIYVLSMKAAHDLLPSLQTCYSTVLLLE